MREETRLFVTPSVYRRLILPSAEGEEKYSYYDIAAIFGNNLYCVRPNQWLVRWDLKTGDIIKVSLAPLGKLLSKHILMFSSPGLFWDAKNPNCLLYTCYVEKPSSAVDFRRSYAFFIAYFNFSAETVQYAIVSSSNWLPLADADLHISDLPIRYLNICGDNSKIEFIGVYIQSETAHIRFISHHYRYGSFGTGFRIRCGFVDGSFGFECDPTLTNVYRSSGACPVFAYKDILVTLCGDVYYKDKRIFLDIDNAIQVHYHTFLYDTETFVFRVLLRNRKRCFVLCRYEDFEDLSYSLLELKPRKFVEGTYWSELNVGEFSDGIDWFNIVTNCSNNLNGVPYIDNIKFSELFELATEVSFNVE
ncbi:MAG: hypothetical protein KatS3mg087_0002 [Patescibacteria group bacterium]|nr:MAG: hypothetical protein KatS3mg087_0002 [Patescibacteria group bacterium]